MEEVSTCPLHRSLQDVRGIQVTQPAPLDLQVQDLTNHLKAFPLHGIGPAGGRCDFSYIPLHIYSPKFCGAAPARGKNILEVRGLGSCSG